MPKAGQLFTAGWWLVKPGREAEFISTWSAFAEWGARSQPAAGPPHLLQDKANPSRFLSFGSWDSEEAIQAWRQTPEFQAFIAKARELCEEVRPSNMQLVFLGPSGK